MKIFQFQQKNQLKSGMICYTFKNDRYILTIYAIPEENNKMTILYPVKVKAVGPEIDIAPDLNLISKTKAELALPPSISIDQVPQFQGYLELLPGMMDSLTDILLKIERNEL